MEEVEPRPFGHNVPTQPVPIEYEVRDIPGTDGVKLIRFKTHTGIFEAFLPKENAADLAQKLRPGVGRGKRAADAPKKKSLLLPPGTDQRLITPPERL